jgi:uncharacterized protein (TIGR00730 family)
VEQSHRPLRVDCVISPTVAGHQARDFGRDHVTRRFSHSTKQGIVSKWSELSPRTPIELPGAAGSSVLHRMNPRREGSACHLAALMNKIRAVCVYCGSSPGNDAAYVEAGERLGSALAAAGLRLIYGGGTTGVMGAIAHGTLSAGGEIGAIIPRFLINRETTKAALTQFNDVTITETMHERKHKMFERSDAFVALPGGIGTVEEIVEIMTWGQLGQHRKPMVFANINGFWDPMLGMLDHLRRAGFIHSGHLMQPIVVDRVEAIIPAIIAAAAETDRYGNEIPSVIDKM